MKKSVFSWLIPYYATYRALSNAKYFFTPIYSAIHPYRKYAQELRTAPRMVS